MEFREWVPVRERLPDQDGLYDTMIKPLLGSEHVGKAQHFKAHAHPAISGWEHMPVTHWRTHDTAQ